MNDRDQLRGALSNVLCNASNFPDNVQSRILGQDLGPLIDKTTDAILESEWLSGVIREAKAEQREVDARIAERERDTHVITLTASGTMFDSRWEQGAAGASDRVAAAIRRAGGTDE